MPTSLVRAGLVLFAIVEISSGARDYFSLFSDFQVSGEEVVIVRTTTPGLGPQFLQSPRQPQLQFQAFNQSYDLTLQPVTTDSLISPHFTVIRRDRNTTQTIPIHSVAKCFYRGQHAAFDLCRSMRGIVILSPTEFLSVEPLRLLRRSLDAESPHLIRRMSRNSESRPLVWKNRKRVERNANFRKESGVTIETAVFVDAFLYNHMARENFPDETEQEMTHFVLAMINAVQLLYQDDSLGHQIDFQVQRLEMWTRQPLDLLPILASSSGSTTAIPGKQGIHDIDRYLNRFCHWQSRENPADDHDPDHWDHALLLTGLDLFAIGRDGFTTHQVVGLAPIGGMCTATSSCTVNEGRHFESVYVVAHEIGHSLGMKHDGREAGNDCDSGSFLMSPTLGSGKTQWSPCSKHYLDAFLNTRQAGCLRDRSWTSQRLNHNASESLPGERFTADQQCMLRYGRESRRNSQRPLNEICRDLRCTKVPPRLVRQSGTSLVSYGSHPALEGTACGEGMWCRRSRCSSRIRMQNYDLDPTSRANSEHPSWSVVTPCASGCLYGTNSLSSGSMAISTHIQNCKYNSPCDNASVRYRTCDGSQLCFNITRTTIQQYSDDVCYQAAQQNSSILPKGIQQLSVDAYRSCQVWCYLRSGGMTSSSGWIYPDGTQCQTGSNTQYGRNINRIKVATLCLSGRCQEFSCDNSSVHQLHADVCRTEEPAESNVVYDYSFPQSKPMAFKYSGNAYYPARISLPETSEHFASQSMYPPAPVAAYPSQTAIFATADEASLLPQNFSNNSRMESVWSPWKTISSCRSGCLLSSKGLRLVQRICESGTCDSSSSSSVQLCIPTEQECSEYQPITSFADQVCRQQHWSDLHRGIQLTERLKDACVVHCRNPRSGELTAAVGETGWFPSGTLCNLLKPAYCLSGRCVEFDADGIPK